MDSNTYFLYWMVYSITVLLSVGFGFMWGWLKHQESVSIVKQNSEEHT